MNQRSNKVNLNFLIDGNGQEKLVSVSIDGKRSMMVKREKGKLRFCGNIEEMPFRIEDIRLMMLRADLVNTSKGKYKLSADYIDNDPTGRYLTYERCPQADIHKTR